MRLGRIDPINNEVILMYYDTNTIFSMTQANQNFSQVAKAVEQKGQAVIFKNNKPKFLVIDMEKDSIQFDLSEDEKIDVVAKRVLEKYLPAFKELAK